MDLGYLLRRAAARFPEVSVSDDSGRSIVLRKMVEDGTRLASALDALGIPPGAAVGILSANRAEYAAVDVGLAVARRVRVGLNARLKLDDHRYVAHDCDMRLLIHSKEFADIASALRNEVGIVCVSLDEPGAGEEGLEALHRRARPSAAVPAGDDEDPAWITYTSGTTGRPKGVILSHRAIREVAFNLLLEVPPTPPGRRIVLTQALSHGAGYFIFPYLIAGAGIHLMSRFDPEYALQATSAEDAGTLKIVPAMLPGLLEAAERMACHYDTIIYGASPIAESLLEAALDRLGPVFVQIYGQSEAPMTLTCLHKDEHLDGAARSSAGRAWQRVAVQIGGPDGPTVEPDVEGEVVIQGPHMMSGYLGRPEDSAKATRDGWLHTGDVGRLDERGFLRLLGRTDEMINSGGYNISPREVETALEMHADVADCAVVGLPDERWGTAVAAIVQLRAGASLSIDELLGFARDRLGFRAPKRVSVVDRVPRNAYGKVDRIAVRSALGDDQ